MRARYSDLNPKRRIADKGANEPAQLEDWALKVRYRGNAEHKRNPGDFGLAPPHGPRPGKSLCDTAELFELQAAHRLLVEGVRRGLVSDRLKGGWPRNIWSVTPTGTPLEAQLENAEQGHYHGYPMPQTDPLSNEVLARWEAGHG
jgi:hypothetical protein